MSPNPLKVQIGGDHYKHFKIQPIEFAMANNLNACQAAILKYIMRDKSSDIEDLNKAKHYIDILIAHKEKQLGIQSDESDGTGCECNRHGTSRDPFQTGCTYSPKTPSTDYSTDTSGYTVSYKYDRGYDI